MSRATIVRVPRALALANVFRNRARLGIALVGVGFAVFLMVFQASLLLGFVQAAQRVITAVDGEVWIMPRGVPSFDFAAALPYRFGDMARQVTGVEDVVAVAAGFTTLVRDDGARRAVLVVGAQSNAGPDFPLPWSTDLPARPDAVVLDVSNLDLLGLGRPDAGASHARFEIGGRRADVVRHVDGFGSFLGSPYVFATHRDATRMLRFDAEDTSFLVLRLRPPYDAATVAAAVRIRLPDVDVRTRGEFATQSAVFWLVQTGAGGAILVAAVLGFLVGLVITSQTMYASTVEQLDEFATLKAIGATDVTVARLVLLQAAIIGVIGAVLGIMASGPLVAMARTHLVAWIVTPWWLRAGAPVVGVVMCGLGSLASVRRVLAVDPSVVLRR